MTLSSAADGFAMLLDYWPVHRQPDPALDHGTKRLPLLLLDHGRVRSAALLLFAADAASSASVVGGEAGDPLVRARHTIAEVLGADSLSAIRAEATSLSVPDLLTVARAELQELRS